MGLLSNVQKSKSFMCFRKKKKTKQKTYLARNRGWGPRTVVKCVEKQKQKFYVFSAKKSCCFFSHIWLGIGGGGQDTPAGISWPPPRCCSDHKNILNW